MNENWIKFKLFVIECKRVLTITKKPTGLEFKTITKVSGIGLLILGFIGFIVQLIAGLVR